MDGVSVRCEYFLRRIDGMDVPWFFANMLLFVWFVFLISN